MISFPHADRPERQRTAVSIRKDVLGYREGQMEVFRTDSIKAM